MGNGKGKGERDRTLYLIGEEGNARFLKFE
jgi:hypothetical protein